MEGALSDPSIPDGEETSYRGLVAGESVGFGTHRVGHLEREGRSYYRQSIRMSVRDHARYEFETLFRRQDGTIVADSYRAETRYRDELVAREEGRFRGVKGLQWGGVLEPFPRDLAPLLGCALALRGLDFKGGSRRTLSLWLANTVYWDVETRVERVERIELRTGRHAAWRVKARPSFEKVAGKLDGLIGLILPPFIIHFEEAPPHRFLRFEFPTGPFRWNPHGLIEATDLAGER